MAPRCGTAGLAVTFQQQQEGGRRRDPPFMYSAAHTSTSLESSMLEAVRALFTTHCNNHHSHFSRKFEALNKHGRRRGSFKSGPAAHSRHRRG